MDIKEAQNAKMNRKSQAALEYILLTGVVLAVITGIFYYAFSEINSTIKMNKANDAVNTLAKSADMVYSIGPGSQDYVQIDVPGGVQSITLSGNHISMKIRIFNDISEIWAQTKGNLTGTLTAKSGAYHVSLKALESGVVQISE